MASASVQINLPLPVLPAGWTAEKDFKSIGQLGNATDRNIEPVGPHFLAHARRVRSILMSLLCCRMLISVTM
jgi:DnaJ family protein C protein 2